MSEWKTRITKVQVVKPAKEAGEACLVLIYPPGPDMGKRFPLARNEIVLGRDTESRSTWMSQSAPRPSTTSLRDNGNRFPMSGPGG